MYVLTSTLNKLRNHAIEKTDQYIDVRSSTLRAEVNHLCYKKGPFGSQIVFCINNQSSKGPQYKLSVGGFQPNDKVIEVLGCTTAQADAAGNITSFMYRGEPRVFVTEGFLKDTGLCPQTTAAGPLENGASAISSISGLLFAAVLGCATLFLA